MDNVVAQIIGFAGLACNGLSFQQKKRKGILTFQICAAILFVIHYILLGAYTGAVLNFLGLLRSIVFVNSDKKWAKSPIWLVVFVLVFGVASALTWVDWYSIMPAAAMILTTVSYWFKNETKIRLVTFPGSPCWLIYNILTGSVAGIATEAVVMTSLIIAIVRYDILKSTKTEINGNRGLVNE